MKFTLTMDCDNAAFTDVGTYAHVAELLSKVARRVEYLHDSGAIVDANGNKVGSWSLE